MTYAQLIILSQSSCTTLDGKERVLPYDKINAELFLPEWDENKQTTEMVLKMATEVAACMLKEQGAARSQEGHVRLSVKRRRTVQLGGDHGRRAPRESWKNSNK